MLGDSPIEMRFVSTMVLSLISVAFILHAQKLIVEMVATLMVLNGAVDILNDAASR